MGIEDLLCAEYKAAKRTDLFTDESHMLPLMDLENSEAVLNFDGSYFKPEAFSEAIESNLSFLQKYNPICTTHAEALHGHERPRISFEQLGKILSTLSAYQHRRK